MQFLGIGPLELLLILVLTVIVVGPERLPEVAAQLAKFIRQAQAYANYVRKDFNEVIGELEKEVGTNREDLKTIAEALRRDTSSVFEEIDKAGKEAQDAASLETQTGSAALASSQNGAQNGAVDSTALKEAAMAEADARAEAEQPSTNGATPSEPSTPDEWFKPTPGRRRRRSGESIQ